MRAAEKDARARSSNEPIMFANLKPIAMRIIEKQWINGENATVTNLKWASLTLFCIKNSSNLCSHNLITKIVIKYQYRAATNEKSNERKRDESG
jgi:hypothetical protein